MTVIPQRELRNQVSTVLRRAALGERLTVTVDGRPVAELGPLPSARKPALPSRLAVVIAQTPVDAAWAAELQELRDAEANAGDDSRTA